MPHAVAKCRIARAFAVVLAIAAPVVVGAPPAAALTATAAWVAPVPGAPVRSFEPPAFAYGAGHRGIDYAVEPGGAVVAAGAGTVEYAGKVAGTRHAVIRHSNGWRTSYSFLSELLVSEGATVRAGEVIAECCAAPNDVAHLGHDRVLHFGLRIGDEYADPALLFAAPELTDVVRLAPSRAREWPAARRSALGMILDTTGLGALVDAGGWLVGAGAPLLDGVGALLAAGARQLRAPSDHLARLGPAAAWPLAAGTGLVWDLGGGVVRWLDQQDECDHDPPPLGAAPAATNRLMFVAGLHSERTDRGASNGFPAERLGYDPDETRWFSYAAGGRAYTDADTLVPLDVAARRLRDQLRAMQREQPGRSVDLVAHSLGGAVVQTFLKFFYDAGDPTLPPLGTIVTLGAPHLGAPLATSGVLLDANPLAAVLIDQAPGSVLPDPSSPVVRDLAEYSVHNARLRAAPLPEGLEVVSIGAPLDWVVPEGATRLDGAQHVTVAPGTLLDQHTDLTTDDESLRTIRNVLIGRPAPCVSLGTAILSEVAPRRIAIVERIPGALLRSPLAPIVPLAPNTPSETT
jgi:hypothetical protein